jgi:hypothetical protein
MKHLLLILTISFFSCAEDQLNEEQLRAEMASIKTEIDSTISITCSENSSCKVIAFGAKACGGPLEYLIYSLGDTDESKLIALVDKYNKKNIELNNLTGEPSDCSVVTEPEIECVSGECKVVS